MSESDDAAKHHRRRRSRVNGGTDWPDRSERNHILLVTRGHPFDRDAFYEVFEANPEIEWSSVEHPVAQRLFNAESAEDFDCFVLYDMPGIEFRAGEAPRFFQPPQFYVDGLHSMFDAGVPFVILHHACAAWPAWPQWAEIVGGHFMYQPGLSRDIEVPDSGYVLEVTHTVTPVAEHPITEGIEPFELTDELYLAHVFEDSVTPLFTSDFAFVDENFSSASLALQGRLNERGDWTHPPGSNLVGWVRAQGNSPIVYLQFGDGPSTYRDENYRRVLANAIRWASSADAQQWARSQPS